MCLVTIFTVGHWDCFCKEKRSHNHMELLGIGFSKFGARLVERLLAFVPESKGGSGEGREFGHWCDCLRLIEWAHAGNLAEGWQFLILS